MTNKTKSPLNEEITQIIKKKKERANTTYLNTKR